LNPNLPLNACRTCGATNYRRVIARDERGDLKPTGLYQCSGCSVVFANPKAWRDGGVDELDARPVNRSSPKRASSGAIDGTAAGTSTRAAQTAQPVPQNRPDLA